MFKLIKIIVLLTYIANPSIASAPLKCQGNQVTTRKKEYTFEETRPLTQEWCISNEKVVHNEELEFYDPSQLQVRNNQLYIIAEKLSQPQYGQSYKSGKLASKDTFLYGTFHINASLPMEAGTWPALWLLPGDSTDFGGDLKWPEGGNIDIVEGVNKDVKPSGEGSYFFSANQWKKVSEQASCPNEKDGNDHCFERGTQSSNVGCTWHTFNLEWREDYLKYWIDDLVDNPILEQHSRDGIPIPKVPMRLIMNLAIGGMRGGTVRADFPLAMVGGQV